MADFIGKANFFDGTAQDDGIKIGEQLLETKVKFQRGAPVRVAIRPERASLDDAPGLNSVPARVTFVRDLGPIQEYRLTTELGPVMVEYALGEDKAPLREGDQTNLRLPPEALHVFPRPQAMAAE